VHAKVWVLVSCLARSSHSGPACAAHSAPTPACTTLAYPTFSPSGCDHLLGNNRELKFWLGGSLAAAAERLTE
jgi:hypothetical protein